MGSEAQLPILTTGPSELWALAQLEHLGADSCPRLGPGSFYTVWHLPYWASCSSCWWPLMSLWSSLSTPCSCVPTATLKVSVGSRPTPIPQPWACSGHWLHPWLSTVCLCLAVLKNHTDVWFVFLPAAPVETQAPAILALAALLILLGLLSTALLGHLLCFHIYLSKWPLPLPPHIHPHLPFRGWESLSWRKLPSLGCRALKLCPFLALAL